MSNIEDDVEIVKELIKNTKESIINSKNLSPFKKINRTIAYKALENILTELKQKDKRIQELEEVDIANRKVIVEQCDYIQNNSIPKQIVIDKIKEVRSKRIKHEIDNKLLLDGVREKYLNNKGKFDSCELVTYCIHNEYLGEEHYLQELLGGEK